MTAWSNLPPALPPHGTVLTCVAGPAHPGVPGPVRRVGAEQPHVVPEQAGHTDAGVGTEDLAGPDAGVADARVEAGTAGGHHVPPTALLITNEDADLCIRMRRRNSLTSAESDVRSGFGVGARRRGYCGA